MEAEPEIFDIMIATDKIKGILKNPDSIDLIALCDIFEYFTRFSQNLGKLISWGFKVKNKK